MWSTILLLLFTCSITVPLVCDPETGYKEYLDVYGYGYKYESNDAEYDNTSVEAYRANCNVFNKKEERGKNPEVTALLDWSDSDLEELSDLAVKYSGNPSIHESEIVEEASFFLTREPRIFTDSSLKDYNQKKRKCSTSWATSVIEVAESVVLNKHFSVDQLLQCVPKYFDMESDCQGVIPKDLITYITEVGLVEQHVFNGCDNVENQTRYIFKSELPVPNKSGLMNLVAKGKPVFAMLALDLRKLRYVKNMKESQEILPCAFDQPTVYGIVSGYNSDEDNAYWEVVSHIIPAEEIIIHIPMAKNETNANYAGIAAYAFTLEDAEEIVVTPSNPAHVKFIKYHGDGDSAKESFFVYGGETNLYSLNWYQSKNFDDIEIVDGVEYQRFVDEKDLPYQPNYQYRLVHETIHSSYSSGAILKIEGIYGNCFFKGILTEEREEYVLSLYYAIMKNSNWRLSSNGFANWMNYDYVDSSWERITLGTERSISGTQYLRKTFTGIVNMAAYELAMNYRYGIVVYLNGDEIFRDNMVEGTVESTTLASGSYTSVSYHSIIRPGNEISDSTCILGVELHFTSDITETTLDFDAFLATYASSVLSDQLCFVYPYAISVTGTGGSDHSNIVDWNKETKNSLGSSILLNIGDVRAYFNGIRMWPSMHYQKAYTNYKFQGTHSVTPTNTDWTNIVIADNIGYFDNKYTSLLGYFNNDLFKQYRVHDISGSWIYELQPLVCSNVITKIEFDQDEYVTFVAIDDSSLIGEIAIQPIVKEFKDCTIDPQPEGFIFTSSTCKLSGRSSNIGTTEYTVTSTVNGQEYQGSFIVRTIEFTGSRVRIKADSNWSQKQRVVIKDSITTEEIFNSDDQSGTSWSKDLYLEGESYTVTLSSKESSSTQWDISSWISIYSMYNNNEGELLVKRRYDEAFSLPTEFVFNPKFLIKPGETWYYKMSDLPTNWYNDNTDGWSLGSSSSSFSSSTGQIQLYKKSFSVSSLDDYSALSLNINYQYGIVIYINGNEVFRNRIAPGELTASTVATGSTTSGFHKTVLPVNQLSTSGENVLAVALIANSAVTASFDLSLRFMIGSDNWRLYDTTTSSHSSGKLLRVNELVDHVSDNKSFAIMDNPLCNAEYYVDVTFKDDRHEWISSIAVVSSHETQTNIHPQSFTLKAKKSGDTEWTSIAVISLAEMQDKEKFTRLEFPINTNHVAYNAFRLDSFVSAGNEMYNSLNYLCYASLGQIDFIINSSQTSQSNE